LSVISRVTHRLTRWAARPHLPQRTIRLRLTVVYSALFIMCGAALLAITYVLVEQATGGNYAYTGPNGSIAGKVGESPAPSGATPRLQTNGGTSQPLTPQQMQALDRQLRALAASQHAHVMHELLLYSGIALAAMAVVAIMLGWLMAGRVLRPLRTITEAANEISATNLHERLALAGPNDELKRLGATIDNLLARLEGAFDAQRRFVANASHELRTPLTVIRALLQMTLTDPNATIDTFRSACREVIAVGEHQDRLIEALLVLARSEGGLDHRQRLDLSEVTGTALTALQPKAEHLKLHVEASIHPAPIDGDNRLAERLVTNLIDNALRHNIIGGRVQIATGAEAGRSFVSVANTGPAIPPDEIPRLLQPFRRLGPDSTEHHGNGLGLGLSIVQAIAAAHDATLTARAHPRGGLDIEVSFPSLDSHPAHHTTATHHHTPAAQPVTTATP
jgi:signal transduction histidine kinase